MQVDCVCGVACVCEGAVICVCVSVQGVWCCVFVCKECGIVKTCLFFRDVVTHTTESEDPFAHWSCCFRCWSMLVLFRAIDFAPQHMRIRHMAGNGVTAVIVDGTAPAILAQAISCSSVTLQQRSLCVASFVCLWQGLRVHHNSSGSFVCVYSFAFSVCWFSNTLSQESFRFDGECIVRTRVLRMARKGARTILDKAPIMNGKKEWLCRVCKTSTVWTRKKCTICDECQRSLSSSTSGPLTCNRMCGMICLHVRNVYVQWQHSTESQSNKDEDRKTNTSVLKADNFVLSSLFQS